MPIILNHKACFDLSRSKVEREIHPPINEEEIIASNISNHEKMLVKTTHLLRFYHFVLSFSNLPT